MQRGADVINLIETLLGSAATFVVIAIVALLRGKQRGAKIFGGLGGGLLMLAILLEIYVRYVA